MLKQVSTADSSLCKVEAKEALYHSLRCYQLVPLNIARKCLLVLGNSENTRHSGYIKIYIICALRSDMAISLEFCGTEKNKLGLSN